MAWLPWLWSLATTVVITPWLIYELAKTTMDGTTALGLVKVAEEIGFETRAIKADMTLFDLPDLTFPFVAHVLQGRKLLHYYVVIGQDKKHIHIADPDPGIKLTKISRERFAQEWTGVSIFMAPSPDYKPHKEKNRGSYPSCQSYSNSVA